MPNSLSSVMSRPLFDVMHDYVLIGRLKTLLDSPLKIMGQLGRINGELSSIPLPQSLSKQLKCCILQSDWGSWFKPNYFGPCHGLLGLHSQRGSVRWIFNMSLTLITMSGLKFSFEQYDSLHKSKIPNLLENKKHFILFYFLCIDCPKNLYRL